MPVESCAPDDIEALRRQIRQQDLHINNLIELLHARTAEKEKYISQCDTLRRATSTLEARIHHLEGLRTQTPLPSSLDPAESQNLRNQLRAESDSKSKWQEKYEVLEEENRQLDRKCTTQDTILKSNQDDFCDLRNKLVERDQIERQLKNSVANAERERNEVRIERDSVKVQNTKLWTTIEQLKSKHPPEVSTNTFEEQLNEKKEEVKRLRAFNTQVVKELETLKSSEAQSEKVTSTSRPAVFEATCKNTIALRTILSNLEILFNKLSSQNEIILALLQASGDSAHDDLYSSRNEIIRRWNEIVGALKEDPLEGRRQVRSSNSHVAEASSSGRDSTDSSETIRAISVEPMHPSEKSVLPQLDPHASTSPKSSRQDSITVWPPQGAQPRPLSTVVIDLVNTEESESDEDDLPPAPPQTPVKKRHTGVKPMSDSSPSAKAGSSRGRPKAEADRDSDLIIVDNTRLEGIPGSIKASMEKVKNLKFDRLRRTVRVKRTFLRDQCKVSLRFLTIPLGTERGYIFPQRVTNPFIPRWPGERGVLFSLRRDMILDDSYPDRTLSLYVPSRRGQNVWEYMGQYAFAYDGETEEGFFAMQPDTFQEEWAKEVSQHSWEEYVRLRVRVHLRKKGEGTPSWQEEDSEYERAAAKEHPWDSVKVDNPVSIREIKEALQRGEERLHLITMTCVSYDQRYAEDMLKKLQIPGSVSALSKPKKRKREEQTAEESTKTRTSSRSVKRKVYYSGYAPEDYDSEIQLLESIPHPVRARDSDDESFTLP